MKANELRIGNYYAIAHTEGIVYPQIIELKINEFGNYSSDGDNLELAAQPVLLTEEWLLKFGFEKDDDNDLYLHCGDFGLNCDGVKWSIGQNHDSFSLINIEHVHQLQNLYFALTGEELKTI